MTDDWSARAEAVCRQCGGRCCTEDTQPPVSEPCYERLKRAGVPAGSFESGEYRRLKLNGRSCILFEGGRCSCHGIKPETCRAGPFTFDVFGDKIAIYLKKESVCPVVRLLKEDPGAYYRQFEVAVRNITHLVGNLSDRELAAICRIDEPETEFIAMVPREPR